MNTIWVTALACLALAEPAAARIVVVSAAGPEGTTIALRAGQYAIRQIGTAQGGAYDAWNAWSDTRGCDGTGRNCQQGWFDSFALDLGHGTSTFDHVDGWFYDLTEVVGDNRRYQTPALARSAGATGPWRYAPLGSALAGTATYQSAAQPFALTLAQPQSVNIYIVDSPYSDNLGGLSFDVRAVPEGGAAAMLFGGTALLAMRRRSNTQQRSTKR